MSNNKADIEKYLRIIDGVTHFFGNLENEADFRMSCVIAQACHSFTVDVEDEIYFFSAPLSYYFRSLEPKGALPSMDVRAVNHSMHRGSNIGCLTWKQLLETDVCINCGRCHKHCPANMTGGLERKGFLVKRIKCSNP